MESAQSYELSTGLHVTEHGIISVDDKLRPGTSIFQTLRDTHGYQTGVFSENTWLTEMDVGLRDGFDTVETAKQLPYLTGLNPASFVSDHGEGAYLRYLTACLSHDHSAVVASRLGTPTVRKRSEKFIGRDTTGLDKIGHAVYECDANTGQVVKYVT